MTELLHCAFGISSSKYTQNGGTRLVAGITEKDLNYLDSKSEEEHKNALQPTRSSRTETLTFRLTGLFSIAPETDFPTTDKIERWQRLRPKRMQN